MAILYYDMFIERTLLKCLNCIELKITFKMKKKENVKQQIKLMKKINKQKYFILESIIISCYEI